RWRSGLLVGQRRAFRSVRRITKHHGIGGLLAFDELLGQTSERGRLLFFRATLRPFDDGGYYRRVRNRWRCSPRLPLRYFGSRFRDDGGGGRGNDRNGLHGRLGRRFDRRRHVRDRVRQYDPGFW